MKRLLCTFIIVWFCLLTITGCAKKIPLEPFTNAGCEFFPTSSFADTTNVSRCCLEHDMAYWQGGTEDERWAADQAFRDCLISVTGNERLADMMYDAVRMGGTPHFPSWYRWGYGWKSSRAYGPLSEEDREVVRMLLDEYQQAGSTDAEEAAQE